MSKKKSSFTKTAVGIVAKLIGVYFLIQSVASIGLHIKILLTDYSSYIEFVIQQWPETLTNMRTFYIKESLLALYYILRGIPGVICVLPSKTHSVWRQKVIWGSVNLFYIIIYNISFLRMTGQLVHNANPYIQVCLVIVSGIVDKYYNASDKH